MHPGATLFLDVCVQPDLWPEGPWPIVTLEQAKNVGRLFTIAGDLGVRQGGVVCHHDSASEPVAAVPIHCAHSDAARSRPDACLPRLPMRIVTRGTSDGESPALDRAQAIYLDSGCATAPDAATAQARAFAHLTAGVRDAVIFGAGVEYGLDRAVTALLRRRIRVHVALDAVGSADEVTAQLRVAEWKRRGVDGATVAMIARALVRA